MKSLPENLPDAPGVYLMKDKNGKVIYVGKALSLRKRVRSYFTGGKGRDMRPAARHLGDHAEDIDFIATRNETEAFILENNLIKKLKPVYNIRLKDDKTFLSLRVDRKHPFPAIVPVRRPKRDGSLYFGPYASARALRATLRLIRTVVPLRDCTDREFRNRMRPCIKYEIGRCPAPCVGLIDEAAYRFNLERALRILRGNVDELFQGLEEEMTQASLALEYEKAARIRDQIGHLKSFARAQKVEDIRRYDADVIGIYQDGEGLTEVVVLFFREGKLVSSQPYTFDIEIDDAELLGQFLLRFYDGKRSIPEQTLIPVRVPDQQGIETYLREMRNAAFSLKVAARGEDAKLNQLARENARLSLKASTKAREGAARLAESLRELLSLKRTPVAIEGVDISTTGGGEAVGALVHFRNGEALKSRFRRYRIRTVKGMDDYAMIREVITRRLKRGLKEKDLPDLILVDGGAGQLNSALQAARALGVGTVDFLGIRKGETRARAVQVKEESDDCIITPEGGVSDCIPSGSGEMHLLQRVRDEAHRFAITYHRNRRQKAGLASPLDAVKGLGASRKKKVLAHFGGLQGLRGASRCEIGRVKGVGPVLAERIYASLHE